MEPLLYNERQIWTFCLYLIRYTGLLIFMPGVGALRAVTGIRIPVIMVLAFGSVACGSYSEPPSDWGSLLLQSVSELLLGTMLGLLPLFITSGLQLGAHTVALMIGLGSTAGAGDIEHLRSDSFTGLITCVGILVFFLLGGHHAVIYGATGLGGAIVPGSSNLGILSPSFLLEESAQIFKLGLMLLGPVMAAVVVIQILAGLIARSAPAFNGLITGYPFMIGVGLIATGITLPLIVQAVSAAFEQFEPSIAALFALS